MAKLPSVKSCNQKNKRIKDIPDPVKPKKQKTKSQQETEYEKLVKKIKAKPQNFTLKFSIPTTPEQKLVHHTMVNNNWTNISDIKNSYIKSKNETNYSKIRDSAYCDYDLMSSNQLKMFQGKSWVTDLLPPFLPIPVCQELMSNPYMVLLNGLIPASINRVGTKYVPRNESLKNDTELSEKIGELTKERERLGVDALLLKANIYVNACGGSRLFLDIAGSESDLEMPLVMDKYSIPKGSLRGFIFVDPMFYTTMIAEQYLNPLEAGFWVSKLVSANGFIAHESRFMHMINNLTPCPIMQLPLRQYNTQSQSERIIIPLTGFLNRNSVTTDIMNKKNFMVYKMPGIYIDEDLECKLKEFNELRDNWGALIVDRELGEVYMLDYNLNDFDVLEWQQLKMLSVVTGLSQAKVLGTSPGGMGSNGNYEEIAYYATCDEWRKANLIIPEKVIMEAMMFNLWGELDDRIVFKFNNLHVQEPQDKAALWDKLGTLLEKAKSMGAIDAQEVKMLLKQIFPEEFAILADELSADAESDTEVSNRDALQN